MSPPDEMCDDCAMTERWLSDDSDDCSAGGADPDRHRRRQPADWDGEETGSQRIDRQPPASRLLGSNPIVNNAAILEIIKHWTFVAQFVVQVRNTLVHTLFPQVKE